MVSVAIDQGVDFRRLRGLQEKGIIVLHQVHDLEQAFWQKFPQVVPQGRAFRLDYSSLGGPDMLADEKFEQTLRIVGQTNHSDAHHIYASYLNRNDYFITENPDDFIHDGKKEKLEALLGVKIRRTKEFLLEIGESVTAPL